MVNHHVGGRKAPQLVERHGGRRSHSLAISKVKFVVDRPYRPERVRNLCQTLIPAARKTNWLIAVRFGRNRTGFFIQKIHEDVKAVVVPESSRKIRIAREKSRRDITGLAQRRSDRRLSRRQANHI